MDNDAAILLLLADRQREILALRQRVAELEKAAEEQTSQRTQEDRR